LSLKDLAAGSGAYAILSGMSSWKAARNLGLPQGTAPNVLCFFYCSRLASVHDPGRLFLRWTHRICDRRVGRLVREEKWCNLRTVGLVARQRRHFWCGD
jgi:hypothetical protein